MTLLLEMVSDLVCPWCWLGKRRIEAAIADVPELNVQLLFRPFELDPGVPHGGVDYKAYMAERFGSDTGKERATAIRQTLIDYGAAENIAFKFDAITRRPNTFDAHRLVRWAQGQGKGAAVKEALFVAYFQDGRDIGEASELVRIGENEGLDATILADLLNSDADAEAVARESNLFRQMGIAGVPTYIANRKVAVQGVEDVTKLVRFLRHAASEGQTAAS